jgi:hypothetical protein
MSEPNPQQLQIVLDESVIQGDYVNFANIIHSPGEFVLDLGRVVPGRNNVKISSRIIMSPLHAKQFLTALAQNVGMYEQKFGEIRIDRVPQPNFTTEEPSN